MKSKCPICGKSNGCAMVAGKEPSSCWCMSVIVPEGMLESLSPALNEQGCICESCIKAYEKEQRK